MVARKTSVARQTGACRRRSSHVDASRRARGGTREDTHTTGSHTRIGIDRSVCVRPLVHIVWSHPIRLDQNRRLRPAHETKAE
jgi:hypothetical protein